MQSIITYATTCLIISLLWLTPNYAYAQEDKNEIKANELIEEAATNSSPSERRVLYEKALKLLEKAGYDKKANAIIADAMVEIKDYNSAARYYGYAEPEQKKEGLMKIGDAYIQDAKEEPAKALKHYDKAVSYYGKAKEKNLGYIRVGDAYFEEGIESYENALKNYVFGKASDKINLLGDTYYAAGEKYYSFAAKAYSLVGTEENFIKSGNLYFDIAEYELAYAQYDTAKYMDGIIKFSDKMFSLGDVNSGNLQYSKVADFYEKKGNDDKLLSLAVKLYDSGRYNLAALFYQKAGVNDKAAKCELYHAIKAFDLPQAEAISTQMSDAVMTAVLKKNTSYLESFKAIATLFDQIKKDEPYVQMRLNETTQKNEPDKADMKIFEENYNALRSDILKELNNLTITFGKLSDETLKKIVRQRFLEYGAVRNILDPLTFKQKLSDSEVKTVDTFM